MGEFELIERVRERLRSAGVDSAARLVLGSGDDAAITLPGDRASAVSVDAYIDGVHFRRSTAGLRSIGQKALAGALSDLAAMGAEPGEAYVTLGVPEDLDEDGCLEVLDGITRGAKRWEAVLAGGDVVRAPALLLAITVVGYADSPEELVTRAGALPGDAVVVTGELGGAAAGLMLIERPELAEALTPAVADGLRVRHLEPSPQLLAGRALAQSGARAMIDISDGLAGDGAHVATASGVALELDVALLPLQDGVADLAAAARLDADELALAGGEDYELLACLPPETLDRAQAEVASHGVRLTPIGAVSEGSGLELRNASERALTAAGFDQLR